MSSTYTDEEDLTDEQIIRRNIEKVAVGVQDLVSPETQDLREQKRKRDQRQYELERARNSKLSEQQVQQQHDRDKEDAAAYLRMKGWDRLPRPPNEKFYSEKSCPFHCGESVMYLNKNSPNLQETDSLTRVFSKEHLNGFNYDTSHICRDLSNDQLYGILNYLVDTIDELKKQMIKKDEEIRQYAMWAGSGR